ncbi:MAG: imidazoleglycerol-phosphate dehydratase HisB [Candidatus Margulisiibacteriota bacterium]
MRMAKVLRKTSETDIELEFNLDGTGKSQINSGIPFFDHMLILFAKHGLFDLTIKAKGDIQVDFHHTVEDIGIALGEAFKKALGDCYGINRYASGLCPMDESLAQIALDISGRPFLSFKPENIKGKTGEFDFELIKEFLTAFVNNAKITLHIDVLNGDNLHHIAESCFKGLGVILDQATQIDARKKSIPSTKGII